MRMISNWNYFWATVMPVIIIPLIVIEHSAHNMYLASTIVFLLVVQIHCGLSWLNPQKMKPGNRPDNG